ncbi:MAG: hypothetical protein OQL08_06635 [Gammaproteobacteria bacterium]|nr:hypothetical protein [Gammaproteobacteria bacterium]
MTTETTTITRTKEEQVIANEMFNSLRDELLKRELSNTENYDKAILTLSSAALGISLTAIKFVVPLDSSEHIWLLKFGWLLLLFSIVTSLSAYLMSNKAISIQLNNATDYYHKGINEAFNRKNIYTSINLFLNKATGIAFIAAISAIVAFVITNLEPEIEKMSTKDTNKSSTTVNLNDSATIPVMQKVPTGVEKNSATIPTMQQAPGTQTTSQGGSGAGNGGNSGGGSSSGNSGSSE